ncbi:HAMP domain-containing protein [Rhodococcus sp. GOMB7]|uniref:HAMP domain-containing sensor histidine kinase n=1 Tax=Rhodococcus sp. GOMB7 TaxID=2839033 RepID=UPI001C0070F6|nr:ATP-binding protein [Rhodococcus sp. GOMB7]MBT9294684.1 HAMP domain-containing protein [Rhodococcus sp. GOMB7]
MTTLEELSSHQGRTRRGLGVGVRLLMAQTLVLVAGAATSWVVAVTVGPSLFREHLRRAGVPPMSEEQMHAEQAYRSATAVSLSVAIGAAVLCALAVTWYLSRRLQRSVTAVSTAATAVSAGNYAARVPPPQLGDDFDALATAFNEMAVRLESAESMRRRLLADLAHEIRTPVAVLEAFMEALEDGVEALDDHTIAMLRDQTRRLARFSGDVSALSDAETNRAAIEPTWTRPEVLVSSAVAAHEERYDTKAVILSVDVPGNLPSVWLDPERIGQVLSNLLDNALRHSRSQSTVKVRGRVKGDRFILTLTDEGDGVAAEHLPYLFERFYRADAARDRAHGGAGIGLSIAKALVEAHGGQITAASDGAGQGTTFVIALPVHRPKGRHIDCRGTVDA